MGNENESRLRREKVKKEDCGTIRKSLRKYVDGCLFRPERIRIERHLKSCPVCSSEYEAIKRVDETRRILKDVASPGSMLEVLKDGVFGMRKLKKLLYRPLWVIAILGAIVLLYLNLFASRRDLEIERIEKSLPPAVSSAPVPTAPDARFTAHSADEPPAPQDAVPKPDERRGNAKRKTDDAIEPGRE